MDIKDFRVDVKVRNNRILARIEEAGYATVAEFARAKNVPYSNLIALCTMRMSPKGVHSEGMWTPTVMALSEALNCMPDDLFVDSQLRRWSKNKTSFEASTEDIAVLMDGRTAESPEQLMIQAEDWERGEKALAQLPERHRTVLVAHLGLDGHKAIPIKDLAATFNVSRSRMNQIFHKALRRLKEAADRVETTERVDQAQRLHPRRK